MVLSDEDLEQLKALRLCFQCVGEKFLRAEMQLKGKRAKCSYCGTTARSYSVGELADRIETTFEEHFIRTSDQPHDWQYTLLADKESSYDWDRDGEQVVYAIMNAADIPEKAAEHIQQILDEKHADFDAARNGVETEFSSDSYYEEKGTDDAHWQREWRDFERSLRTEARFFNSAAARHLASVFEGLDTLQTREGRSIIADAGPGSSLISLYRARAFYSDGGLTEALMRPDRHIGPPPPAAAHGGRMNARGISVFYGANDPQVALAEVRPPVGSQVVVARFEIIRPIRLLDLTALAGVAVTGSIFDPSFNPRLERAMFLRSLSRRIMIPVMPHDEADEYLATQAIADFLATEATVKVDGIIFPSVQAAGEALNVVLFRKAGRVAEIEFPKATEISARLGQMYDEGWEREYAVVEEVPPKDDKAGKVSDGRPETLKIDLESVTVHVVEAVKFTTEEHRVRRHRWEKRQLDF